jgi:hypothetical protein
MNRGGYFNKLLFFIIIGLIVIGVLSWLLFFSYKTCDDWDCFNKNLEACSRTRFIGGTKMIFEYTIRGPNDGKCEVLVELLQGELNNQDSLKMEGQKMTCLLPRGVVMIPESDIGNCHGRLKEGLQDLVIKKLYSYLVQNLGKINLEILDISQIN